MSGDGGGGFLDFNASKMATSPNVAYIFDEPPYGGMFVGAESLHLTFRVANGVVPFDTLAPRVDVSRTASFRDLVYAFWAERTGGQFGVDRYVMHVNGLQQDTQYYVQITASPKSPLRPWPDPDPQPDDLYTLAVWTFRTPRRDVTVDPAHLTVHNDGDPGGHGGMAFKLGVYDGDKGDPYRIVRYPTSGYADITDGHTIDRPFGTFVKQGASNSMTMYISGEDEDSNLFSLSSGGSAAPDKLPASGQLGTQTSGWEDSASAGAWAQTEWNFLQMPGVYESPFSLFSGRYAISYTLIGTIRYEVIPWAEGPQLIRRFYPAGASMPRTQPWGAAVLRRPQAASESHRSYAGLKEISDQGLRFHGSELVRAQATLDA